MNDYRTTIREPAKARDGLSRPIIVHHGIGGISRLSYGARFRGEIR
jgi:hypothetical protein